jgi:hypothetical protein
LRKVEALFFGAATDGEREAAGAAAERLKAKLDQADAPVELKFVMPDQWSVRLFIALCLQSLPLRAPAPHDGHGQGAAPAFQRRGVAAVCELHDDLWAYLDETTERVIRETIHPDAADAETAPEPLGLT